MQFPPSSPEQRFRTAVQQGDIPAMAQALDDGADINMPIHRSGANALHSALKKPDMLEFLLERGIEIHNYGFDYATPLREAVQADNPALVKRLLEYGADPNWPPMKLDGVLQTGPAMYPLHRACVRGNREIVRLLLEHGAEANAPARVGGTPLWYALANDNHTVVQHLLEYGVEPNGTYETISRHMDYGKSPPQVESRRAHSSCLFSLARKGRVEMLDMMLDAGADADYRNEHGRSAEEFISQYGRHRQDECRAVFARHRNYPRFLPEEMASLTKAEVFTRNEAGYCLLDSPSFWQHFEDIAHHLATQGEGLTVKELAQENPDGKSYFARGVECFAMKPLLRYCQSQGEEVPLGALLGGKEGASPTLEILTARHQLPGLFRHEVWQGQNRDALQSLYRALPPQGREQLGNYYQLLARLAPESPSRGR